MAAGLWLLAELTNSHIEKPALSADERESKGDYYWLLAAGFWLLAVGCWLNNGIIQILIMQVNSSLRSMLSGIGAIEERTARKP